MRGELSQAVAWAKQAFNCDCGLAIELATELSIEEAGFPFPMSLYWDNYFEVISELQATWDFQPWLHPECWADTGAGKTGRVECWANRRWKCGRCRRVIHKGGAYIFYPRSQIKLHPACELQIYGMKVRESRNVAEKERERFRALVRDIQKNGE